jgi:hypothetical protein
VIDSKLAAPQGFEPRYADPELMDGVNDNSWFPAYESTAYPQLKPARTHSYWYQKSAYWRIPARSAWHIYGTHGFRETSRPRGDLRCFDDAEAAGFPPPSPGLHGRQLSKISTQLPVFGLPGTNPETSRKPVSRAFAHHDSDREGFLHAYAFVYRETRQKKTKRDKCYEKAD